MIAHPALRLLHERPELAELAAYPFNVDIARADHGEDVRLASGAGLEAIAGDDTGGTYFLCSDGAVLYASSEGEAGLVGESLDEALEVLIGLPGWDDYLGLDPDADKARLAAAVATTEAELAEYLGPGLDSDRVLLLTELGLRRIAPPELIRRLHRALRRTEPEYLLLNADELCAYAPLDRLPRPRPGHEGLASADLALRQGRTELARCLLVRLLDDSGPRETGLLGPIATAFDRLGDAPQAARARRLLAAVHRTPVEASPAAPPPADPDQLVLRWDEEEAH